MAKLMEILELGKRAESREGNIFCTDGEKIYKNGNAVETMTFELLTRDDFEMLEEYKTNFDIQSGEKYFITSSQGITTREDFEGGTFEKTALKHFNCVPVDDETFAKYVKKRQLLDRKMMTFSYLNGADKMKGREEQTRFTIENSRKQGLYIGIQTVGTALGKVYFEDRKVAEAFLELNRAEIEEVINLKEEIGF